MSYFNDHPPVKEEIPRHSDFFEGILLYVVTPVGLGFCIAFLMTLVSINVQGRDVVSGFIQNFIMTTATLGGLFWGGGVINYLSYLGQVRAAGRRYQEELKEYNRKKEEQANREAESKKRGLEIAEANARKRAIEQEKERARAKELEAKAAIEREKQERQQAFWGAHNWALGQLEHQYHALAIQLAAEHRVTDRDSVIKVFVEAWPHLPLASDVRAGCLRYRAASDDRIAAIQHLLPPPSAENTQPD